MRFKRIHVTRMCLRFLIGTLLVAGALTPRSVAAQQATVTGRVTTKDANAPLGDARVFVVGTSQATTTNGDGQYTFHNAPVGQIEIRVLRVGYHEQKLPIQVSAGGTARLDFAMVAVVTKLEEVVTTATGEQRKVELGNALSTIPDVATKVEQTAVTNIGDLLIAKAPGVFLNMNNVAGGAPVIHVRGLNSLALTNNPIVVIDGIRFNSSPISGSVGGTNISYMNSLDPEEIQDIEIVKGPSAATLYGTDASNGVIVITTKKGRAGNTKWTWFAEGGAVDDRNTYPATYALWGHNPTTGKITRCELALMSATTCVADSLTSLNIPNSSISPLSIGKRTNFGGQASGGSDQLRFFISSDLENEIGPYKMPAFAQQWLDSVDASPPLNAWVYPEAFQKMSARLNMSASLSPVFDVSINSGFSKSDQRLPEADNNVNGIGGAMYLTAGTDHAGLDYNPVGALGQQLHGYARYTPANVFQNVTEQGIQRFLGSADAHWHPLPWMQNDGTVGIDLSSLNFFNLCLVSQCTTSSATQRLGFVADNTILRRVFTAKAFSTSSWNPRRWLNVKTTAGADYLNNENQASITGGATLPPGAQTVGAAATKTASDTQSTAVKTLGVYLQEQAAFRDRVFLTAAVRSDQNSAFGSKFQRVFYPKASLSWLLSDESFFPTSRWLDEFRLRGAWGQSGVEPAATAALQTYSATTVNVFNADVAGLTANAIGNANLKPETSAEFEGGFDAKVLNRRVNLEVTYYSRQTSNALVSLPIAPSAAPSATSVQANLGSVKNAGIEALTTIQLLDSRRLAWDLTVSASHNSNRLVSLGLSPSGNANATIGTGNTRDSVGLPINAETVFPYTYSDANHDGVIQSTEVTVTPITHYFGSTFPRDLVSIQNGFDLFQRRLRLTVLLDYKGGYNELDTDYEFICQQAPQACSENEVASTPLWQQARAVAENYGTSINGTRYTTQAGYYESGQFWRLREVSATVQLPGAIAHGMLRAADANLSLQGRNLHVWTRFLGIDPEATYGTGDTPTAFLTQPPRTYLIARLNLHY
jgi:TonB-linked SusC/RagA family outer membrane protein